MSAHPAQAKERRRGTHSGSQSDGAQGDAPQTGPHEQWWRKAVTHNQRRHHSAHDRTHPIGRTQEARAGASRAQQSEGNGDEEEIERAQDDLLGTEETEDHAHLRLGPEGIDAAKEFIREARRPLVNCPRMALVAG